MDAKVSIVWFRQDLRLQDQPALAAAKERGGAIVPLFIRAPHEQGDWAPGGAMKWWLHQNLAALAASLEECGSRLIIRRGDSLEQLREVARQTEAGAVYWNRRYEPAAIKRDKHIKQALRDDGLAVESFNGSLIYEPWEVQTKQGGPYKVFTPYWRACQELPPPEPPDPPRQPDEARPDLVAAPEDLPPPKEWPPSESLDDLGLEPTRDWASAMAEFWTPGEAGAAELLKRFYREAMPDYPDDRDLPAVDGTSRLSPYLHLGVISPRQVWHEVQRHLRDIRKDVNEKTKGARSYLREIGWREFGYHLLYHFPHTPTQPLQEKFADFPWADDWDASLHAWQKGQTGYPLVDAGMRQLWAIGWMHNRVRMIVASFLVKDLLIPWQEGARWFWDTLIDADLANNTLGWQWAAGSGADAAPFFRIFNPVTQSERFDAEGDYIRRWVPELAKLPKKWIHKPWQASPGVLREAGVELGEDYPRPIVDHKEARERALDAFEQIKGG